MPADEVYVPGPPEYVSPDDPIVHGRRWRQALEQIRDADPVDMALDPNWPARIAADALASPSSQRSSDDASR